MRVLVTGGSGFIGSHVVDKLRAQGHEPVIYDLRPSPWHNLDPAHPSVDTVLGSITDREALERALHSCDAVAHLAAVADVNDVHAEPEDAERVNARGTVAVLEAARRAGVKRIVYASTIWVYSDCEQEVVDEDTLLPAPSHLYTSTKLAGELYCKAYQELYGIDYTILRFGIPYGPRAREAAVIPAFVNKALKGEPLTLAGDGGQSRRFVYVEDLAEGVALGLSDVAKNRVYNLASDENVTINSADTSREQVARLFEMADVLQSAADYGDANQVLRATASELLPGFSGALYVFNNSRDRLVLSTSWGLLDDAPPPETIQPDACWALKRGKPHLDPHRRQQALLRASPWGRHDARNPDDCARRDHGAVPVVRRPATNAEARLEAITGLGSALADGMSLALANMGLRESRNQALRDPLTGLYNRRYMEDCLQRFVRLAERESREVSIVMVDLDHFKRLNDTHGHAFGDAGRSVRCSRPVASSVANSEPRSCRPSCACASRFTRISSACTSIASAARPPIGSPRIATLSPRT